MKDQRTVNTIRQHAKRIFATQGYEGLSMRALSTASGVGLSSIYHFFADKDVLLLDIYNRTNTLLGVERAKLPLRKNVVQIFKDLVAFQFDHMEDVVFVLKYYLHYRQNFLEMPERILPPKAYLHIEQAIYKGIASGQLAIPASEIAIRSRVATHAINGFLLEYYPYQPPAAERRMLVENVTDFIVGSIRYKEVPMEQK